MYSEMHEIMIVPGSQFILAVGITGVMVKGNTPIPEPGRIVRDIRFLYKLNILT